LHHNGFLRRSKVRQRTIYGSIQIAGDAPSVTRAGRR
jgi:hypothetical protein